LANKEGVELTNLARRIAAAFDTQKLGTGANDNELYTFESQFGVKETMNRIEANLKKNGVPVFGKYDHEANAQGAGLSLLADASHRLRCAQGGHTADAAESEHRHRTPVAHFCMAGCCRQRVGELPADG
jgi:hypothetical protein